MTNEQALLGAVAVIVVIALLILRAVFVWRGASKMVGSFDHYLPFAIMASKYVEENVPDTYGENEEDSGIAKGIHKLDLFLKKFLQTIKIATGEEPTEALKKEAMVWSVELAERMKKKKEDK